MAAMMATSMTPASETRANRARRRVGAGSCSAARARRGFAIAPRAGPGARRRRPGPDLRNSSGSRRALGSRLRRSGPGARRTASGARGAAGIVISGASSTGPRPWKSGRSRRAARGRSAIGRRASTAGAGRVDELEIAHRSDGLRQRILDWKVDRRGFGGERKLVAAVAAAIDAAKADVVALRTPHVRGVLPRRRRRVPEPRPARATARSRAACAESPPSTRRPPGFSGSDGRWRAGLRARRGDGRLRRAGGARASADLRGDAGSASGSAACTAPGATGGRVTGSQSGRASAIQATTPAAASPAITPIASQIARDEPARFVRPTAGS